MSRDNDAVPRDIESPPWPERMKYIYFIGIGGTAMGSMAGMLKQAGYKVRGSDKGIYPPMSDVLRSLGIEVLDGFDASHLDERPDLVIVGNACTPDNPEAVSVWRRGIPFSSLPAAMYRLFLHRRQVSMVSGTHGKTTTTTMLAHVLTQAGTDPSFLAGGVSRDLGSTFRLGKGQHFVIEGDEYDSAFFDKRPKFVHYRPRWAVITSLEFDHADIYSSVEEIEDAFRKMVMTMPKDGRLLYWVESERASRAAGAAECRTAAYGVGPGCDIEVRNYNQEQGRTKFEVVIHETGESAAVELGLPGLHNALNAAAAMELARYAGVSPARSARALSSFQGVKRRQELLGRANGVAVVDDFAHHPTAVALTVESMRSFHTSPGGRVWALFEPRSNTARTDIHKQEYIDALARADCIRISRPYNPRGLPPEELLDVDHVVKKLADSGKDAATIDSIAETAGEVARSTRPGDVVLVMSNGDFGGIANRILNILRELDT